MRRIFARKMAEKGAAASLSVNADPGPVPDPGLGVENMPMPMDSAIGLTEFAGDKVVIDEDSHIISDYKVVETEGWYKKYCRWAPTSPALLEQAEKKVLSYIKTLYRGQYVDIGSVDKPSHCKWSWCNKTEDRRIWTVVFNENSDKVPLLIVHGLCASIGLWSLNVDALAADRSVYAIDLLGFGRSSRPKFSNDASEAEAQHVEAIEAWRKQIKLERFILLGHSMGGFLSTSYALKYPERVAHLVLADPWGFPKKPDNVEQTLPANRSMAFKAITTIGQKVNPLAVVRAAGPLGPRIIDKVRPDLVHKFEVLNQNGVANVAEYIYHCNAQKPTGEEAFRTMMDFFGWAKHPMQDRLEDLKPNLPLTMIYGGKSWLQRIPDDVVRQLRPQGTLNIHTIFSAGHHLYADDKNMFNSIVNKVGQLTDKLFR